MTRAQVAKAIGRSISSVRRMEGKELNPQVDWRGVHWFDEEEVKRVAEELRTNGRRGAEYISDMPEFLLESQLRTVRAENDDLRTDLDTLRTEMEKLEEIDELAACFVKISREAIQMACDNDCRGWRLLEMKFQRFLRAIPS